MNMIKLSLVARYPGSVRRRQFISIHGALGVALVVAAASQEPPGARDACVASVVRLCPVQAMAGDHDGAKRCLLRNLRKASPQCRAALGSAPGDVGSDQPRSSL